ncbi:MAG: hypothetical protein VB100_13725 [Angelakisella sp.]|nr:hypothetical protein [Angelakisella sp.]
MAMDNILEFLVETDKKAAAIVSDAEDVLESTISNLDRDVQKFKEEYTQRAIHRIGIIRDEEGKASQEAFGDIAKRYDALMANLDQAYEEHHKEWEKELFERCILP